jgi:molybdate transport system regulatory protein
VALFEEIEQQKSMRKAAATLGMSYRRAWSLVQSMNAAARKPLVETSTGGNRGGGTLVTPFGKAAILAYHGLEAAVNNAAKQFVGSR